MLLTIALAACGGASAPSGSAFRSGFKTDKAQFRRLGVDLQHAIGGAQAKTNAQLATEFDSLSTRARQQASKLAKLDPPAKYKHSLDELVAGFKAVAGDLSQIASAARANDVQGAKAATRSLVGHAAQVKAADVAISDALGLPTQG